MKSKDKVRKFKSLDSVLEFLITRGYGVSRPTLFRHRKAGRLIASADGTFLESSVLGYANSFLVRDQSSDDSVDVIRVQEEKLVSDARRAKALATVAEARAKEADCAFIPREQHEIELAKRALYLKSDLQNLMFRIVPELCSILDGADENIASGIQYAVQELDIYLGRYTEHRRKGDQNG